MLKTHYFKCSATHLEYKMRGGSVGWGLVFVMCSLSPLFKTKMRNTFIMDEKGIKVGGDYEVDI